MADEVAKPNLDALGRLLALEEQFRSLVQVLIAEGAIDRDRLARVVESRFASFGEPDNPGFRQSMTKFREAVAIGKDARRKGDPDKLLPG